MVGKHLELQVKAVDAKLRLDVYLSKKSEVGLSRAKIKQLIQSGDILVNESLAVPKTLIQTGDTIHVQFAEKAATSLNPENISLDIVHEDEDVIAINKPAQLVVHPGAGQHSGTLVNALLYHFNQLSSVAGDNRPGIVHRLDKETSGILLIAKNDQAHASLSEQFAQRTVEKVYEAICFGVPKNNRGLIEAPISRHHSQRIKMTSKLTSLQAKRNAREAITEWQVLTSGHYLAHLRLYPKTGRTHQIRVHLAEHLVPIIGDKVYGPSLGNMQNRKLPKSILEIVGEMDRHALHACSISFHHPRSGKRLTLSATLAPDMQKLIGHI